MNYRRFALPAAIALGLHAILFFGFSKPPTVVSGPGSGPRKPPVAQPPPPDVQVPVELKSDNDASDFDAKVMLGSNRPQNSEIFSELDPNGFRMDLTNPSPIPSAPITPYILPIGDPNGVPYGEIIQGPSGSIVDSTYLDRVPAARYQPSPIYPIEARRYRMTGTVEVEFVVGVSGEVRQVNILKSTNPIFDAPTFRAVSKWRFEPGRHNNAVVAFRMRQPITFDMTD
ncbi:MAG: energy transducer TonB [Opitutaceae bacterium]|jgi:protein TonB